MKEIRLSLLDPEISVRAVMLEDINANACEIMWNNLPYQSIQLHTLVAGKNIYNFVPTASPYFTHKPKVVRRLEAKPGTIFSPFPRSMYIKYGSDSEDHQFPPIAEVYDEDLDKLEAIGKECWNSIYKTKKPCIVQITKENHEKNANDSKKHYFLNNYRFSNKILQKHADIMQKAINEIWLQAPTALMELIDGSHSKKTNLGSFGQYFSTIYFVEGELNRISNIPNIGSLDSMLKCNNTMELELDRLKTIIETLCATSIHYLEMCQQKDIAKFYSYIIDAFSQTQNKQDIFQLISIFTLYISRYHSWALFLFPWVSGNKLRYRGVKS